MNHSLRLKRLQNLLKETSCDGLIIEHPIDLFYLTGLELSAGQIFLSEETACLMVDGRYIEICSQCSPIPVILLDSHSVTQWLKDNHIKTLGFDQSQTTYQRYLSLTAIVANLNGMTIQPLPSLVQKLRIIKDKDEQMALKAAAKLNDEGYQFVLSLFKEGIEEKEIAFALEFFWKKQKAKNLSFDPIIAFEKNGSMPHYRAGHSKLTHNCAVLIDIGVCLNHYHSDMTRTVFFGNPAKEIIKIYQIVQEAKDLALSLCQKGTPISQVDQIARDYISSQGYGQFFNHSLGHGVGLEIHEAPAIKQNQMTPLTTLETGMVITIEPGIYLPGIGGVRIEDTIIIQDNGYENLYSSIKQPIKI